MEVALTSQLLTIVHLSFDEGSITGERFNKGNSKKFLHVDVLRLCVRN